MSACWPRFAAKLKTGARVELIQRKYFSFPAKLVEYMAERQITTLIWAVSALCILSSRRCLEHCRPQTINKVMFSGEVMPPFHPMGKAFANEKVFLLDNQDRLITETNVPGELCVSGTALALGYYNDRDRTNAVFIQNPLNQKYNEPIY